MFGTAKPHRPSLRLLQPRLQVLRAAGRRGRACIRGHPPHLPAWQGSAACLQVSGLLQQSADCSRRWEGASRTRLAGQLPASMAFSPRPGPLPAFAHGFAAPVLPAEADRGSDRSCRRPPVPPLTSRLHPCPHLHRMPVPRRSAVLLLLLTIAACTAAGRQLSASTALRAQAPRGSNRTASASGAPTAAIVNGAVTGCGRVICLLNKQSCWEHRAVPSCLRHVQLPALH